MYETKQNEHDNIVAKDSSIFSWYYRQYCLVTGLYMLEPWERSLFNCVVFGICAFLFLLPCKLWHFTEKSEKMTESPKVEILLKAVGDAPILKQNKWTVDEKKTVAELSIFLRNYMKLNDSDSLLLFINQCFAPSPDQTVRNLKECFAPGDSKLVINYSKTQAWG